MFLSGKVEVVTSNVLQSPSWPGHPIVQCQNENEKKTNNGIQNTTQNRNTTDIGDELGYSGRMFSSCPTSGTRTGVDINNLYMHRSTFRAILALNKL
jgi:hypothetical protein